MFAKTEVYAIRSPLNPAQIAERFSSQIVSDYAWFGLAGLFRRTQFIGHADTQSVRIRVSKNAANAFQPVFSASIEPTSTGSTLHCRIGIHRFSFVLLGIFAVASSLCSCCVFGNSIAAVLEGRPTAHLGFAVFLFVFVVISVMHGWHLQRGERELLRSFVQTTLAVTP